MIGTIDSYWLVRWVSPGLDYQVEQNYIEFFIRVWVWILAQLMAIGAPQCGYGTNLLLPGSFSGFTGVIL